MVKIWLDDKALAVLLPITSSFKMVADCIAFALFLKSFLFNKSRTVQLDRIATLQIHHLITESSYNKSLKKV